MILAGCATTAPSAVVTPTSSRSSAAPTPTPTATVPLLDVSGLECPSLPSDLPEFTRARAAEGLGKPAAGCSPDESIERARLPQAFTLVEPWDGLLATDGFPLPVELEMDGTTPTCDIDPNYHYFVYSEGQWFQARYVGCGEFTE